MGTIKGERVPTSLLAALMPESPLVLDRDFGRALDVTATFSEPAGSARARRVAIQAKAEHLEAEFTASVTPDGAVNGDVGQVTWTVTPALAAAAGDMTLAAPVGVALATDRFSIPAHGEDGTLAADRIAFAGSVRTQSPIGLTLPGKEPGDAPLVIDAGETAVAFATDAVDAGINGTVSVRARSRNGPLRNACSRRPSI